MQKGFDTKATASKERITMVTPRVVPASEILTKGSKQAARETAEAVSSTCPRCRAIFVCGATAATCWCETLAVVDMKRRPEDLLGKGCLCEACLRAAISDSASGAIADSATKASAD